MNPKSFTLPLAALSIGLGLAELLAPRRMGRAVGLPDKVGLLRAYGARELMAGAMILGQPFSATPLWMRVAGDAVDLLTLAPATRRNRNAVIATAVVLGVTLIDLLAARARTQSGGGGGDPVAATA